MQGTGNSNRKKKKKTEKTERENRMRDEMQDGRAKMQNRKAESPGVHRRIFLAGHRNFELTRHVERGEGENLSC